MGLYRARDLWKVPGLLSLSRLPLAAAFPLALDRPAAALSVLLAAGVSDVLDGWYARRFAQVTPTGTALDPVTDKIFVLTVAVSLVLRGYLSPIDVVIISTREIAELPLVVWVAASRHVRRHRSDHPTANLLGKLATFFQFAAAAAAIFRSPHVAWLVAAAGLSGVLAAVGYWMRALREWNTPARVA
jgi:CDP-diacylglycerol--glycerol-3-phosphate 3-phosphatidyltransferase/cardiolipin synthase